METYPATSADRRSLLKLSILAGLGGAFPLPARAQERELAPSRPMPTVDARYPAEVAPGVFILPDKRIPLVPNIGIIVGANKALVVDCGLGIDSAENVLQLARRLAPGREIILTVTHAHPEHGFGAQVFKKDARIYYNSAQRDYFLRSGQRLLDGFRAIVLPAAQKHLLDGIELTPPHGVYETPETIIDLGGREAQLRTWGTAHSPGDQIVFLPKEGILFAGDLIEERMFPIVPFYPPMITAEEIDLSRWIQALNDIQGLEPRLIVPGHGNLGATEIVQGVQDYFTFLRETSQVRDRSTPETRAILRRRYPTWENPEFIDPAVAYLRQFTP